MTGTPRPGLFHDPEMDGPAPPPGSWRGRPPLSIRFGNPTRVFRVLADLLAPLRHLRHLILPLGLVAGYGALFNVFGLEAHMTRIALTLSFAQNLVIGMLTANLLGKATQGLAMARHGADSDEFGFRLAFGVIPKFYLFKGPIRQLDFRGQRACYAAPLLFRLGMFVAGLMIWLILRRSGSGVADVGLALAVVGLSSFLFTANPLFPADGYRWLAAWLERPRLRQDGLRLLGMILTFRPIPADLPRSEFWLLVLYALASLAFTAFIVLTIVFSIAFVLEARLRGVGVVIFGVLLAAFVVFLLSFLERRRGRRRTGGGRKAGQGRSR
ncbi:MAG: hypothetical protein JJT81_00010 [Rubellimicrobium sp.]|nr:hypothetical protein [Rubellimicrobium sp.]